jgi:type II secretory pathway pseudopilin PulG
MKHSNNSGMTLIEVLLYISLLSIMVVAISAFTALSLQARIKGQTIGEVEQSSAQAIDIILTNIRFAKSISTPTRGNSASNLSLIMPGASQTVDFRLNGGKIEMQTNGAGYNAITFDKLAITSLNFANTTKSASAGALGSIKVNFRSDYINNSGRNEYDFGKYFQGAASLKARQ